MKIIQLSDPHLRVDGRLSFHKMDTLEALRRSIDYFETMEDQPDLFMVTGDLADNGNYAAYEVLKLMLSRLKRPVYVLPGNHDNREAFLRLMPEFCPVEDDINPYICYTLEDMPVRVIVVETIDQGRHWGKLTDPVAKWLEARLLEQPQKPTMVFTHHPPFKSGLPAMDEPFVNDEEFARILKRHNNLTLCTGHLHRAMTTTWQGVRCIVCPPISMLMDLDFTPKGGDAFYLSDPGYLLHSYYEGALNTYVGTIPMGADYSGPHPFTYLEGEHKEEKK